MDWALQQAYPGCHPNIVALGGSGAGVQAWLYNEKRSRTEHFPLDVKGLDVKTELDQPADVLVIMLGMNDVLAPYVVDEPASWAKWKADYRELVTSLQSRLKPKVTALATVTLCTEDTRHSPKNAIMDKLNQRVEELARGMRIMSLPTNQSMQFVLMRGRESSPDFHVTHDYVHPNEAGHLAIACGMLRGLGEDRACQELEIKKLGPILAKGADNLPRLSFDEVLYSDGSNPAGNEFTILCSVTQSHRDLSNLPKIKITGQGWTGAEGIGAMRVVGSPDRRENVLKLSAQVGEQTLSKDVTIPAPWLVTSGLIRKPWNEHQPLVAAAFRGPIEEVIERGGNFMDAPDPTTGEPLKWKRYFATVNYTGGANPDSVDFAAITHARNFEAGYGARWIQSDRDRPVNIELSTQTFAGVMQMGVWLNGTPVYSGLLTGEPGKKKTISAKLHVGWNTLVFALNHVAWQMQCTVHLAGVVDDSLDDLRYSIAPHGTTP
jgi:lysophospholipase L1-like esterase